MDQWGVPASVVNRKWGCAMPSNPPNTKETALRAALDYVALGWPVVPGAVWRNGHFADPVDGKLFLSPALRPIEEATTDPAKVREWWSAPGLYPPNILTPIGAGLGAFTVSADLTEAIIGHPWFGATPTPVLAIQDMPLAYFLVRPPLPAVLLSDEARVLDAGVPLPLPPTAIGDVEVIWLVTPEQANGVVAADELADLIRTVGRKIA
jgi:hypothetical protein